MPNRISFRDFFHIDIHFLLSGHIRTIFRTRPDPDSGRQDNGPCLAYDKQSFTEAGAAADLLKNLLPVQDLLEIIVLRIAHIFLGGLIVSLGDVVGDEVVVVLGCA